MKLFKSIGAVLAGMLSIVILSIATDLIMEKSGVFPGQDQSAYTQWMLALALAYRSIYTVVGGYVTAKCSPNKVMTHAMVLAGIGMVMGTLGAVANWDKVMPGTEWYPIAIVVESVPLVWLGAKMKLRG